MIEQANELLVIDHHKSAVVELHDISNTIFDMNKSGATLALGGEESNNKEGNFYQPTIFDNVSTEATIAQEEIFGPVTTVFDFNTENEAIDIANSTNYGLASGVFTADDEKAKWTAERIQAGIIWHNDWFVDGTNLPGGGYKKSGYGRDGGMDGIYSHGQTKRVSKRLY